MLWSSSEAAKSNLDDKKKQTKSKNVPPSLFSVLNLVLFSSERKRKIMVGEKREGSREQDSQVQVTVREQKQREFPRAS